MDIEEHYRWRGNIDARMNTLEEKADYQQTKIVDIEKSQSRIISKLSVPLFLTSIVGVVIGAVLVALIGKLIIK